MAHKKKIYEKENKESYSHKIDGLQIDQINRNTRFYRDFLNDWNKKNKESKKTLLSMITYKSKDSTNGVKR